MNDVYRVPDHSICEPPRLLTARALALLRPLGCARNCARGEPAPANFSQRDTPSVDRWNHAISLSGRNFNENFANEEMRERTEGGPAKPPPRFKSGRRLQSFLTIQNAIIARTYRRVATFARRFKYSAYSRT